MNYQRLKLIFLFSFILLILPLIAMQFSDEVNWTLFDFVIAGVLLLATAVLFELVVWKVKNKKQRITLIVILIIAFFLIWAELAVGIIVTPISGN